MIEFGKVPIKEFSIVDILSYFIPGSVILFAFYISHYWDNLYKVTQINNSAVLTFALLILSYLTGHIFHYPAVVIGRLIISFLGNPNKYLIELKTAKINKFKTKLRCDFSKDYKEQLTQSLVDFWKIEKEKIDASNIGEYLTLSEVLVEDHCPNVWIIHERFYCASNLFRALIIPTVFLGAILFVYSKLIAILLFCASVIFGLRFYSMYVACVKQIYNGFYLFYLNSINNLAKTPTS